MSKKLHRLGAMVLSLILMLSCFAGCGGVDTTTGATKTVYGKDARVIATSVATCEILDALGFDNVVGVPETSSYTIPERYADATSIGSPMAPDMEIVSSLKADVIFSPASLEGDLNAQYENIGLDSYFLDLESVDGMFNAIDEIGQMLEVEDAANKLIDDYLSYKEELSSSHKDAPTVLILMGLPGGAYVVATENSYAGSLVKLAGGVNVYGDGEGKDFLNINAEDMVEKQPDIILRTAHALPEQVYKAFETEFETNDVWSHFDAVKNGKVYNLDNEKFGMSARLNYKEGIQDLEEILYE